MKLSIPVDFSLQASGHVERWHVDIVPQIPNVQLHPGSTVDDFMKYGSIVGSDKIHGKLSSITRLHVF